MGPSSDPMSSRALPEVKFADDLKVAARMSPAITEFVDVLMGAAGASSMDSLNRVAGIAYKYGGLKGRHQANLVRVWMEHDPAACGRFIAEDRVLSDERVRALEKANGALKRKVNQLEADLSDAKGASAEVETQMMKPS